MSTLRVRLALGMLWALGAVLLALGVGLGLATRSVVESYMETRLDHDAESLLSVLEFDAEGRPSLRAERVNPLFQRVYSGHYFVIITPGGVLRSRSLWQDAPAIPAVETGMSLTRRDIVAGGGPLLMRLHGYRKRGQDLSIAVAEKTAPVEQRIRHWQWAFGLATLLALLSLLVFQGWILRRGLAPLEGLRAQVEALKRGVRRDLSEAVPGEVLPLVREINHLLAVLDERLARSRKAAGDLAHALKLPLSVLAGLKQEPVLRAHPRLAEDLSRQLEAISTRIDRELRRARLMGGAAPGVLFDPSIDVQSLVDTLKAIHRDKALGFQVDLPEAIGYSADREDMLELLGNLLDNASKWARGRVRVSMGEADGLRIDVEDDGPGVSAEEMTRLQRRGERLDERVEGHGLGLAIAHDVVAFYGGELAFDRSPDLGGLRVRVSLPRA